MSYTITVRELKTRQDNGDASFLLDVREPHEYSMAKIEGSVLIPLGELPNSLNQLDKNSEIVAYCHKGMRSADAVVHPTLASSSSPACPTMSPVFLPFDSDGSACQSGTAVMWW